MYEHMEKALQDVSREYIALSSDEERRNNAVVKEVLNQIIDLMKKHDPLFNKMYSRPYHGGSYYDNLKVGTPNEYDLDLVMYLPEYAMPTVVITNVPGFVHVQLKNYYPNYFNTREHLALGTLLGDNNRLTTKKILSWTESILSKVLAEFPALSERYPNVKTINTSVGTFAFQILKAGPAFTVSLKCPKRNNDIQIDIDLVPCFLFKHWPGLPYRPNPSYSKQEYLVVPKTPKHVGDPNGIYWRLSFQEQESLLIHDMERLKPALRLIKKLRDVSNDTYIASYYLKTIVLWEVQKNRFLFGGSLSMAFMALLKQFEAYVRRGEIPYFWNSKYNLLANLDHSTKLNLANKLRNIIDDIDRHMGDSRRIYQYFVQNENSSTNRWNRIEDLRYLQ